MPGDLRHTDVTDSDSEEESGTETDDTRDETESEDGWYTNGLLPHSS